MGGKKKQTVGYRYFLGMHLALAHGPLEKIIGIYADEKEAWTGIVSGNEDIFIDKPNLFGGEDKEGGLRGTMSFAMGAPSQQQDPYLVSRTGDKFLPAYRGVSCAIAKGMYVGTTSYLKKLMFRVQRIRIRDDGSRQWYPEKCAIGDNLNAIHIIRECITNKEWGMGYPESSCTESNFKANADVLYNENFGLSVLWNKAEPIEDFVNSILEYIDGAIYVDRHTGNFIIKLLRDDYNPEDLLEINENHISEIRNLKTPNIGELTTQVTVKYYDRKLFKLNSVTVKDAALQRAQQCVISHSFEYSGITNPTLATRVAQRELQAMSSPLTSFTAEMTSELVNRFSIGDPVKVSFAKYGLHNTIVRVSDIRYGTTTRSMVSVDFVQDVFSMSREAFGTPPETNWVDPNKPPSNVTEYIVTDTPYRELVQWIGDEAAQALTEEQLSVLVSANKPTSNAVNVELWGKITGQPDYLYNSTFDFPPVLRLDKSVNEMETQFKVINIGGRTDFVEQLAQIGNELIFIESVQDTDGNLTIVVKRGVCDTYPAVHAAEEKIIVFDSGSTITQEPLATGEIISLKLLPSTGQGRLQLGEASEIQHTVQPRALKPYPPANVKINDVNYPSEVKGALHITWRQRNRITQSDKTYSWFNDSDIAQEHGTTYSVNVSSADGTLVAEGDNLESCDFSVSVAPDLAPNTECVIKINAVRELLKSAIFEHRFIWTEPPKPPSKPVKLIAQNNVVYKKPGGSPNAYQVSFTGLTAKAGNNLVILFAYQGGTHYITDQIKGTLSDQTWTLNIIGSGDSGTCGAVYCCTLSRDLNPDETALVVTGGPASWASYCAMVFEGITSVQTMPDKVVRRGTSNKEVSYGNFDIGSGGYYLHLVAANAQLLGGLPKLITQYEGLDFDGVTTDGDQETELYANGGTPLKNYEQTIKFPALPTWNKSCMFRFLLKSGEDG